MVMQTLGHAQISITLNTYSHVSPELSRDAADRLQALLSEPEAVGVAAPGAAMTPESRIDTEAANDHSAAD